MEDMIPQHSRKVTRELVRDRMRFTTPSAATLNGSPATVTGHGKPFATVTDVSTGLSAQWSWESVERVMMYQFGRFNS